MKQDPISKKGTIHLPWWVCTATCNIHVWSSRNPNKKLFHCLWHEELSGILDTSRIPKMTNTRYLLPYPLIFGTIFSKMRLSMIGSLRQNTDHSIWVACDQKLWESKFLQADLHSRKIICKEFFFATLNSRSIVSFLENLIFYQPNSNKKNPVRNLFATLRSAEANVPLTVSYKSLSLCHLITISNIAHKKRPETRLCLMRMEWIWRNRNVVYHHPFFKER